MTNIDVAALLAIVTGGYDRISMHGVRRELLVPAANSLGSPLDEVFTPQSCTNEIYKQRMRHALEQYQKEGISAVAIGDLCPEKARAYRQERMRRTGMPCLFPVWGAGLRQSLPNDLSISGSGQS